MSKVRAVSKLALVTIVLLGACSLADISEHLIPEKVHSETKTFSTEPPIPSITPSVETSVTQPPDNLLPRPPCYRLFPFMLPPPPPPPGPGENMAPVTNPMPPVPTCSPEPTPTPLDTKFEIVVIAGSTESGYVDGPGDMARFSGAFKMAIDRNGNIYVTDSLNNRIRKIDTNGMVTTVAGSGSMTPVSIGEKINDLCSNYIPIVEEFGQQLEHGYVDGKGDEARFYYPSGITLDANGNIYIVDNSNHRIRQITSDGIVSTFAGSDDIRPYSAKPLPYGYRDGAGDIAQFYSPADIIFDPINQLFYVVESTHIRKIAQDQTTRKPYVTTLKNNTGQTITPSGSNIAIDSQSNLYTTDENGINKITPQGEIIHMGKPSEICYEPPSVGAEGFCEGGYAEGPIAQAQFRYPAGVVVDRQDNLYVADSGNCRIREITPDGMVSTIAEVTNPLGITIDRDDNIYVSQRHRILKLTQITK